MPTTHADAVERPEPRNEVSPEAALMIRNVHIKNFRCFEQAHMADLGLINIVVGDNRAGKTSLLEALYIGSGNNLENHLKVLAWRGMSGSAIGIRSADVASGALWRDMFFQFRLENAISIQITGDKSQLQRFSAEYREPTATVVGKEEVEPPIAFTLSDGKKDYPLVPKMSADALTLPNAPADFIHGAMLAGTVGSREIAERFSMLDVENRAERVVKAIRSEFPEIQALSLQAVEGQGPILHADTGLGRKVPLPLISAGVNKLVAILLAIESFRGNAVFVDEIENGFYYQRLPGLWRTLTEFASLGNPTQLFVTTHSGEALRALLPTINEDPSMFRLVRVVRTKEGGSVIRVVHGENLAAAIEEHIEVR